MNAIAAHQPVRIDTIAALHRQVAAEAMGLSELTRLFAAIYLHGVRF